MTIVIVGGGAIGRAIAEAIEGAMHVSTLAGISGADCIVPVVALPSGRPLDTYDEASWGEAAEAPLREARVTLQTVRQALGGGAGKVVFALSTAELQRKDNGLAAAVVTEGIRAMGKSCALAWASEGITVNFLAVTGEALLDPVRAQREVAPMVALLSRSVGAMTASTVVVDGGELMLP